MYYEEALNNWRVGKYLPIDFIDELIFLSNNLQMDIDALATPTNFGAPWGYEIAEGKYIKLTDTQHGAHALSLLYLLEIIGTQCQGSNNITIVDLGSGFGGTIEKIARWYKKRPLRVISVDIPLNLTTAYAFIKATFPNSVCNLIDSEALLKNILESHSLKETQFIFVPTIFSEILKNIKIDILINAHSLSEMSKSSINFYLETFVKKDTNYFIEWNSNNPSKQCGHREIPSNEFPVPSTHKIIHRSPGFLSGRGSRYINTLWKRVS